MVVPMSFVIGFLVDAHLSCMGCVIGELFKKFVVCSFLFLRNNKSI